MKKIVIYITVLLLTIALFSFTNTNEDKDLCKVNKYSGKYVFWMCEPVAEYEEVFTVKATVSACSKQTSQSESVVKEAIVQSSLSKIEFDAVIVGTTERDVAIKFKNTTGDKSIGKVKKINGVHVFIDCIPVNKYNQEKRVKKFRKVVGNRCLMSVKLSERITKTGAKSDALLIGNDQFHWWIKFE
jgi:uncharacterized protein (DUF608 family)